MMSPEVVPFKVGDEVIRRADARAGKLGQTGTITRLYRTERIIERAYYDKHKTVVRARVHWAHMTHGGQRWGDGRDLHRDIDISQLVLASEAQAQAKGGA